MWLFSVFFFKQKTAYEMRISDWSSDVCSSDLLQCLQVHGTAQDLPSNDKSWRARDAQRLRQGQVAVDGLLDHRILHVCFEPLDVQPELGRNSEYKIGIGRAVGLHECLMEGQVAALAVRSQGRLGSIDRVRAEDGALLVDGPQLRVRRLGLAHDRSNTPAEIGRAHV